MESLVNDLRHSIRSLAKHPAFTLASVLTLSLGIGANTAIFSVVNAVLLRPLPFPDSDRLVAISSTGMGGRARFGLSYPDYHDIGALPGVLSSIGVYTTGEYNLTGTTEPREVRAAMVTPSLFGVLGVGPAIGQAFKTSDEREPVALLSHGFWQSVYGRDPATIGRLISLDGRSYTVVGVMPASFHFPDEVDIWLPIGWGMADPQVAVNRGYHAFNGVGRLGGGADLEQLRTALDVLSLRIEAEQRSAGGERELRVEARGGPGGGGGGGGGAVRRSGGGGGSRVRIQGGPEAGGRTMENGFVATSLRDAAVSDIGTALAVLAGAVGLVLGIACANAANLLVARANRRRKEIAVRRALGADRWRLVRQLLTESVVLALGGAAVGTLLAFGGLRLILSTWPNALPRVDEIGLDARVLAFTLVLSVVTGIAFGLIPAWRASTPGLEQSLRDDSGAGIGRQRRRTQATLVVSEIALALVLLVGAGLLVRSFILLNRVDPGLDTRDVLAARIRLTPSRYASEQAQRDFFDRLLETLRQRPGLSGVTLSRTLPLSGNRMMLAIDPRTVRPDDPDQFLPMGMSAVGPDFFSTFKIPLRQGRGFTPDDRPGAPAVAIINDRLARRLWPDQDAIGKTIPIGAPGRREATVVGIIDARLDNIADPGGAGSGSEAGPEIILPLAQSRFSGQLWVILRGANPLTFTTALRDAVRGLDAEQPISEIVTMAQMMARLQATRRLNTALVTLFAVLALVLAVIGIYGVTAYEVSRRTREFGVRIALGARGLDVLWLVMRENLAVVGLGLAIGIGIAVAATRLLASLLFGVTALDVVTFLGTALLLAGVALAATLLSAGRATRVDPMIALRSE